MSRTMSAKNVVGFFTADIVGHPIVAYVERRETDDPEQNAEGIYHYYVVKHSELFDSFLWSDDELKNYIHQHEWAWTYHEKEVA